jgi:hypothetical protein
MKALLACWLTALAVLAWLAIPRPPLFQARWVAMPAAMSWDMLSRARKAAEQPAGMTYTYYKYPDCKRT